MRSSKFLLIAVVLLFSGSVFAGIAGYLYLQQAMLESTGLRAEGVVVELLASTDSDGTTYAPVFQFQTQSGQTVKIQSNSYANPPAYTIGEPVTILYPPENPVAGQIQGANRLIMLIFGVMGGLDLLAGLGFAAKKILGNLAGETDASA